MNYCLVRTKYRSVSHVNGFPKRIRFSPLLAAGDVSRRETKRSRETSPAAKGEETYGCFRRLLFEGI